MLVDDHSAEIDFQDLSGSVQSLGFRLELDPNYADLLAEPSPDKRYGGAISQNGASNNIEDDIRLVKSSKQAQQSFINGLLANAKAKRLATFNTRNKSAGANATRMGSQQIPSMQRGALDSGEMNEQLGYSGKDDKVSREGSNTDLASASTLGLTITSVAPMPSAISRPHQARGKNETSSKKLGNNDVGRSDMYLMEHVASLRAQSPVVTPPPEIKPREPSFLPEI